MTLDFDALMQAVEAGALEGLNRGAQIVSRRAKARAPVRNVTGHTYRMRAKTGAEMKADVKWVTSQPNSWSASTLRRDAKAGKPFGKRWQGPKRVGDPMSIDEALEHLADYDAGNDSPLSRRGASEVRSGLANFGSVGNVTVGGRLRGEIRPVEAKMAGDKAEAWVISPTPYAKYMEFGSRHNRAHPFLRPALEESRQDIVAAVRKGIARASKKGLGHAQIELAVRL